MAFSAEDGRRFFRLQQEIDREECRRVQALGGPDCGGPLDRNDHARKPRGLPFQHFDADPRRLNLCCRHCRAHHMPASVVYLGRRVYVGVVLVLASILVCGLTPRRLARVQAARRGLLLPPVAASQLPNDLVGRFVRRPGSSRLLAFLRFLSPLTVTWREGRGSEVKFA